MSPDDNPDSSQTSDIMEIKKALFSMSDNELIELSKAIALVREAHKAKKTMMARMEFKAGDRVLLNGLRGLPHNTGALIQEMCRTRAVVKIDGRTGLAKVPMACMDPEPPAPM